MKSHLLLHAADFAANKHRLQRRKGGESVPYINHPIAVARLLAEVAGIADEAILAAALLHDTIEDTGTTPEELEREFGARVCGLVQEVTDDKSLPRATRKAAQITHAPHLSPGAAVIKLADKITNVRDIASAPPEGWTHERCVEYFDWAARVVAQLPKVSPELDALFARTLEENRGRLGK
ncbi:MAG: HD domain-containing protein [Verrucomicrobiota bacterium]